MNSMKEVRPVDTTGWFEKLNFFAAIAIIGVGFLLSAQFTTGSRSSGVWGFCFSIEQLGLIRLKKLSSFSSS